MGVNLGSEASFSEGRSSSLAWEVRSLAILREGANVLLQSTDCLPLLYRPGLSSLADITEPFRDTEQLYKLHIIREDNLQHRVDIPKDACESLETVEGLHQMLYVQDDPGPLIERRTLRRAATGYP